MRDLKETDKRKSAAQQIIELRKNWQDCFLALAKGDPVHLATIKAMPILEFWAFYDDFMKRIKQETEINKSKNKR